MPQPAAPVDRLAHRQGRPRPPGARALRTRAELLDCTATLVRERPYREVTPALVTQRAGVSAPAFYRYFADLTEAIVELSDRMAEAVHGIADLVREGDWQGDAAVATARDVIDHVASFWAEHRALYRVSDLLAEEGDARFAHIKATTFADLSSAFADVIEQRGAAVEPEAQAGVIVAALIHTTAREPGFELAGITAASLREHLARVIAGAL